MKISKRITAWLILCLLLVTAVAPSAYAAGGSHHLTIIYDYDGMPIPDARFYIYHLGDVTEDGTLQLTGKYKDYPVILEGLTGSDLQAAADTLYAYIQKDGVHANQVIITNQSGYASGASLTRGLYLITGKPCMIDDNLYYSQPHLVALTDDLILEMKSEVREIPYEPQTLSVLKKWIDEGYESKRPESVSVSLVRDGEVLETVTLNAENNWRHTWTDLEPGWEWAVAEDCPDQFAVTLQREGDTFVLTNTRTVFPQDPPPASDSHAPAIPQTGLVWWPVLALLAAGILLIVAGVKLRRKERKDA